MHRVRGLVRGLELQQQLAARVLRLVLEEFLQVQHVAAEPGHVHRRHDGAHAPLVQLRPAEVARLGAHHHLLARVAHPGPQVLERGDVAAIGGRLGRKPRCQQYRHQPRPCRALQRSFTIRTRPSCAVLATSRPSRANTLARAKPRAPDALGLSMAYSSHSSTRSGR